MCSWGSSSRDVAWRKVAMTRPSVSGCCRPPLTRTRVVAPYRSRWASTAATATSCASTRPGSPVSAHHTDTDFGAEKVASNPATAGMTLPSAVVAVHQRAAERTPDTGSWPDSNASSRPPSTGRPGRARRPGGPPTAPPLRAVLRQVARVVGRARPPPTRRRSSSPAASAPPPPACGHLSVDHQEAPGSGIVGAAASAGVA